MYVAKRSKHNPILVPDIDNYWEAFASFNMCPIQKGNRYFGLYRAISESDKLRNPDRTSIVGIAESKDGTHFEKRRHFITPSEDWDKFGCEDPRATFFEGKYYTFYTALSGYPFSKDNIKVAVAISKDFKEVDEKHLVTPFNAKAMTLFPKRINGKVTAILAYHTDQPPAKIAIAEANNIEDFWSQDFWQKWEQNVDEYTIDPKRFPYDHIEVGAPPVETKYGWLLVYSHIQNYFPSPENLDRIFGIEVLLLDKKDPTKIIGRTGGPVLVPTKSYEMSGYVPNVIFPSGALIKKDTLTIYYGASDTTTCIAHICLSDLVSTMLPNKKDDYQFKRAQNNPIISPIKEHKWEAQATFNPAAIRLKGQTHILYRTLSDDNTSSIGYAVSKDGLKLDERLAEPVYVPREDFEMKKVGGGNSGCEDPRLTEIGKIIYMCYTAFDSIGPPRVAVTSITEKDFLNRKWNWAKPVIITPEGFDDKDTCLFPEKFSEGYLVLHRTSEQICGDYIKSLDFKNNKVKKCIRIIGPRKNAWDSLRIGIASPPLKTKYGWLLLYHGVSKSHSTYRVGAVLLDLKDPSIVLARTTDPIFEPREEYEKRGVVNNVVFPCGMVVKDKLLYIYYGGGDKVTGVATIKLDLLLKVFVRGSKFR